MVDERWGTVCIVTPSSGTKIAGDREADNTSALRYLARQPILDLNGRVRAYELLFRSGPENIFRGDGEIASHTILDNTIMFGLEVLTRGLPCFINCTADVLIQKQVEVLSPGMCVLEILESVEATAEVVAACAHLKSIGFRLALDDFVWRSSLLPLIKLADFVKIDFLNTGSEERREIVARLHPYSPVLLAEKVESRADFDEAAGEGFTLFQGYYFCAPSLMTQRTIPPNKHIYLELLRILQKVPLDIGRLSEILKHDPSLTYRLLRLVNSPMCAIRQEVASIRGALLAVGDDLFRRVAVLAISSELSGGQASEILRMAIIRARFCELAAGLCSLDSTEQHLLGMFSLLPAMLHASMEEVIAALPLQRQVRDALLSNRSGIRYLLQWIEAEERGDWTACASIASAHGMKIDELNERYREALMWAEGSLSATRQ